MRPDAAPIQVDASIELRTADQFDIAIRTGLGDWPDFEMIRLMPVDATPMLSPSLAATVRLSSPDDLAQLPLLPHDDWDRWFLEAGARALKLNFGADEYPTHELDASAAVEGAGVALLSPTLFASLIDDGKLVQPFAHVVRGPGWHYLLLRIGEARPAVRSFSSWLQEEVGSCS
jgi:LysR family transcriptional regulator, glycine cleavage system transcriptional activator